MGYRSYGGAEKQLSNNSLIAQFECSSGTSAALAQLVEHIIRNDGATGSSPERHHSFPKFSARPAQKLLGSFRTCVATWLRIRFVLIGAT